MSERSGARPGRPAERGARDPVALTILYRGPLASCNYDCAYCPFAKRHDPPALLRADRAALERFTAWVADQTGTRISVLFTPWGEGLTRSWYRTALTVLSRLSHVDEMVYDWVRSPDFDALLLDTVRATYPEHEHDRFIAHFRGLIQAWLRDQAGTS